MRSFGGLGLAVAVVVLVLPSSSWAADFTWGGATTDPHWSNAGNWAGGTAPSGSVGTLTFPTLMNPACTAVPPTDTCFVSNNDISGLSASELLFTGSQPYLIQGNGITLGANGLTASPPSGNPDERLDLPITLGAAQTWTLGGGSSLAGISVEQSVSGAAVPLTADLAHGSVVSFTADAEVGTFNAVGADSTQTGFSASNNGSIGLTGSLNGTDGNAVNLKDVAAAASTNASVGPLMSTGGAIELTLSASGPSSFTGAILTVDGGVTLDSASATQIVIVGPGTTAGADYSQLSASGPVNLGGPLSLIVGPSCQPLHVGDVDTLITTTGALSGKFTGIPDGTVVPVSGCANSASARINYTAHSVTATVTAGAPSSSISLAASPPNPVTNQPVTLTATIMAASGSPSGGTVAFGTLQGPFTGCASQPVRWNGTTGTATCQISFTASSSPEHLGAQFTPTNMSVQGSFVGPIQLAVGHDTTATAVAASNTSPAAGQNVTYTATVTPSAVGPAEPSGTVKFVDGGATIAACGAQPLTAGPAASTATCTVNYAAAGSHSITAVYSGDADFTGSTSPAQAVSVQSSSPGNPGGGGTPPAASGPTGAQIAALLSSVLAPHGTSATIGALLAHGGYTFTLSAPAPGTLTITWYYVPPGAHVSKAKKPKPIAIASARVSFTKAGPAHVTVRLTPAGRHMLAHARTLHVVSKAGYQATGAKSVSTKTKRFTLRR